MEYKLDEIDEQILVLLYEVYERGFKELEYLPAGRIANILKIDENEVRNRFLLLEMTPPHLIKCIEKASKAKLTPKGAEYVKRINSAE